MSKRSIGGSMAFVAVVCAGQVASAQSFVEPGVNVIYTFEGEAPGDQFGWVAEAILDITGDGVMEILIGANTNDDGGNGAGKAYVYDGASGALIRTHVGIVANARMGHAVRNAFDVNNDGTPDYAVGSPLGSAGRAHVFSGADGSELYRFDGEALGDQMGHSVSGAGDLNGDGFGDVLVGAINHDTTAVNAGRAYVFSGADGALIRTHDGEGSSDGFGSSVAPMGDVDGDGVSDYAVGAPGAGTLNRGAVYAFSGATGAALWTFYAESTGSIAGQWFTSSPGDVNGDGVPDLYIPDYQDRTISGNAGAAHVVCGASGTKIYSVYGTAGGQGFGIGRGAGDVNGDGLGDLLLASWSDDVGATNAGKAQLFDGRTGRLLRTVTSDTAGETLGFDAAGMGDVNGDGYREWLVTAAWNSDSGAQTGKVYVIAGQAHDAICDGDWNANGLVNTADFAAYLNDYNAELNGQPFTHATPKLAGPCGALSTADFVAYLNAYVAGCP